MSFLEAIFTSLLLVDVLLGAAAIFFAIKLLKGQQSKIDLFFGLSAFFLGMWLFTIPAMFINYSEEAISIFLVTLTFLEGLLILHFFMLFTFFFPYSNERKDSKIALWFLILSIFIGASLFIPGAYVESVVPAFPFLKVLLNPLGLTVYSIYFIALAVVSFRNLITKYNKSDGIHKTLIRKVMNGTLIAVVANLFFSILIYFFTDFDTNPIGAPFTFFVLSYIYSIQRGVGVYK